MRLFDEDREKSDGPANHSESTYSYLNRSTRPSSNNIRKTLQAWFEEYPKEHQNELSVRMRHEFDSAFFELLLFTYLRQLGYSVDVHPNLGGKGKNPDFLAMSPSGLQVVIEATLANDLTESTSEKNIRTNLFDQINKLDSPEFFLEIKTLKIPAKYQPAGRKIRAFLLRELGRLNQESVRKSIDGGASPPQSVFEDGKFKLVIRFRPKSEPRSGQRAIGAYSSGPRWGGPEGSLCEAVDNKATHYGQLGLPFVIAVNCIGKWGAETSDFLEALFGSEEFFVTRGSAEEQFRRKPDGAFFGPSGIKNSKVSAVMFTRVFPWSIPNAEAHLIHNPWAIHPCENAEFGINEYLPSKSNLIPKTGKTFGQILNISDDLFRD